MSLELLVDIIKALFISPLFPLGIFIIISPLLSYKYFKKSQSIWQFPVISSFIGVVLFYLFASVFHIFGSDLGGMGIIIFLFGGFVFFIFHLVLSVIFGFIELYKRNKLKN